MRCGSELRSWAECSWAAVAATQSLVGHVHVVVTRVYRAQLPVSASGTCTADSDLMPGRGRRTVDRTVHRIIPGQYRFHYRYVPSYGDGTALISTRPDSGPGPSRLTQSDSRRLSDSGDSESSPSRRRVDGLIRARISVHLRLAEHACAIPQVMTSSVWRADQAKLRKPQW